MARGRGKERYYAKVRLSTRFMPDELVRLLLRQHYHIVGNHSAAKLCHWAALSLKGRGECYKAKFYGIASHRCLQCTPAVQFCNHACVFCWRFIPEKDRYGLCGREFEWDDAASIVDGLVRAQKDIVSGYGGNRQVGKERYEEAMEPAHAAISLAGEPAAYPFLEQMILEFHRRKMTTFLVTNGTFPQRLSAMRTLPTQLYVSMVAPNTEVYARAIRPMSQNLWGNYLRTLELLPLLGKRTRTVLRMTLVRGVNDFDLDGYARQIRKAQPHYVEVKGFVFMGGARQPQRGLSPQSMLEMDEIGAIAEKLSEASGYRRCEEHLPSRVVLLCRDSKAEEKRLVRWE
ncbi:MAG: 4-demethylwyosine synthase TYW1 [Candidatus Micrarchaeota archaeon]|nr:4-demethylwyosine synthase TYW1 [Candidatus Micrarchaeota archaeon]